MALRFLSVASPSEEALSGNVSGELKFFPESQKSRLLRLKPSILDVIIRRECEDLATLCPSGSPGLPPAIRLSSLRLDGQLEFSLYREKVCGFSLMSLTLVSEGASLLLLHKDAASAVCVRHHCESPGSCLEKQHSCTQRTSALCLITRNLLLC